MALIHVSIYHQFPHPLFCTVTIFIAYSDKNIKKPRNLAEKNIKIRTKSRKDNYFLLNRFKPEVYIPKEPGLLRRESATVINSVTF